ncbi:MULTISPECIES: DJ-1/PfpI family protein [Bacillaceae]|jgi:transcriptional regulator GlxA family with amidase domain|uniref:DJ-1/PfpI family protein n=1 Tax=Bacillaceae TaxID=186817 RepID=UPI001F44F09F|nr:MULTISPECIES: DJ-1/PfpI family protein [Bacillaceae]MCF2649449.1 DJ-1/PfpI family protein [Niallia circulans]CAI9391756.1 Isonitrile hydratase [Bacillus sp. T2.9-1]
MKVRHVGIFIFNEVEVLDIAGPFEVFSLAGGENKFFHVHTISEKGGTILARNGLKIEADFSFEKHPDFDILVVPGGYGAEEIEMNNSVVINWIKEQSSQVEYMTSVCTGAFLLAKAGLLDERRATTHWMDIDRMEREFPKVQLIRNVKFVEEGQILTSGGISAGIDMSFHIVEKLCGKEVGRETARRMEYDRYIEIGGE